MARKKTVREEEAVKGGVGRNLEAGRGEARPNPLAEELRVRETQVKDSEARLNNLAETLAAKQKELADKSQRYKLLRQDINESKKRVRIRENDIKQRGLELLPRVEGR